MVSLVDGLAVVQGGDTTGLMAVVGGMFFFICLLLIGVYIYTSYAFMRIGQKANLKCPGVAWVNPLVVMFEISKMHWWPWAVLVIGYLFSYGFVILSPAIFTTMIVLLMIFFAVVVILWQWKTFESVNRPGWWAVVSPILSVLGFLLLLGGVLSPVLAVIGIILLVVSLIAYLAMIGAAAWGSISMPATTAKKVR